MDGHDGECRLKDVCSRGGDGFNVDGQIGKDGLACSPRDGGAEGRVMRDVCRDEGHSRLGNGLEAVAYWAKVSSDLGFGGSQGKRGYWLNN